MKILTMNQNITNQDIENQDMFGVDTLGELSNQATPKTPSPKKRKNNPEQLRHLLICAARDLMLKEGINNLSMQKVADEAKTSKGGLFHHFKNKDELVLSVIGLFIAQLNTAILQKITENNLPYANFTQAYAQVILCDKQLGIGSEWANLIRTINAEPQMSQQWQNWLKEKLRQFDNSDCDERLALIRYAVDGAWLDDSLKNNENQRDRLYRRLMELLNLIK